MMSGAGRDGGGGKEMLGFKVKRGEGVEGGWSADVFREEEGFLARSIIFLPLGVITASASDQWF